MLIKIQICPQIKFNTYSIIFFCLGYDSHLKDLVSDSYLQKILEKIDNSTNPNEELEKAMMEPTFEEFAKRCLDIVKDENVN